MSKTGRRFVRELTPSLLVRAGHAAWERDGVTLADLAACWPALASLPRAAMQQGRLRVVEFGGALGRLGWQRRAWFERTVRVRSFAQIVVDRAGFVTDRACDQLTLQSVPPSIYNASYPCWFFAYDGFARHFAPAYRLVHEWRTDDATNIAAEFRGLLWERCDA